MSSEGKRTVRNVPVRTDPSDSRGDVTGSRLVLRRLVEGGEGDEKELEKTKEEKSGIPVEGGDSESRDG